MKKTLSQKMAENLSYYVGTGKRCVSGGRCRYSGKSLDLKTQGCFVGRMLSAKDRETADAHKIGTVGELISSGASYGIKIPRVITNNRGLMREFQSLHDRNQGWDGNQLNEDGKTTLINIISEFNLDKNDFKEILK